jgi:hypothetical protein
MATTAPLNVPASTGLIESTSLAAELLEKQLQALERFQTQLVALHSQYTNVFQDIMTATNGEILKYVRILPSVIKEQTKDLLEMDIRAQGYTIYSGFEHTRQLITNGINASRQGLEDFYTIGHAILAEEAKGVTWIETIDTKPLERFMGSKEGRQAELANNEKEIVALEAEVVILKAELDMVIDNDWKSKASADVEMQEICVFFT